MPHPTPPSPAAADTPAPTATPDDVDAVTALLTAQDWWTKATRPARARRSAAEALLRELLIMARRGELRQAFLARMRDDMLSGAYGGPRPRRKTGLSVGYRRGAASLRWIDVPGEFDPVAASRAARLGPGRTLLAQGYREYGITPIIA